MQTEMLTKPSGQSDQSLWLPLGADLVGLALIVIFLGPLRDLFTSPSILGGQVLFFTFFALGLIINLMKRLEGDEGVTGRFLDLPFGWLSAGSIPYWGFLTIIGFVFLQWDLNAIADDFLDLYNVPGEVNEGELGVYVMFGPTFVWFIAAAIFYAGLVVPTTRFVPKHDRRHGVIQFVSLLAINLTAGFFGIILWQNYFLRTLGVNGVGGAVLLAILLVALFLSMRLRHIEKNGSQILQFSYLGIMLSFAAVIALLPA